MLADLQRDAGRGKEALMMRKSNERAVKNMGRIRYLKHRLSSKEVGEKKALEINRI